MREDLLGVMLMLVFAVSGMTVSLIPIVADDLTGRFSLSGADLGLLTSVYLLAYGAAQLPAGRMAGRYGGRVLGVGLASVVAGSLVFALSSSLAGFIGGRVLQGLGGGTILPAASTVLAHHVRAERLERAWGIFGCGWGVGSIAALVVFPLMAQAGGYRLVFLATAGYVVLAAGAAFSQHALRAGIPPAMRPGRGELGADLLALAKKRDVNLLGLCNAAGLAVGVGALAWTPLFLQKAHDAPATTAALLTAGMALAELAGTPAGPLLAARVGSRRVLLISFIGLAGATAAVPQLPGLGAAMGAVLLVGFLVMLSFAPMFALVPKVVALQQVGLAGAYVNVLGYAGSLGAPWLFGVLLDTGRGFGAGYLLLAAFAAVAAAGVLFLRTADGG